LTDPVFDVFFKTLIINKRLKCNFSSNILIFGESGAGKSSLALRLAHIFDPSEDDLKHICEQHIVYTPSEFRSVLSHVFLSDCKFPLLIYMEAREVYESRRALSTLNVQLTRIAQLSRSVRNTVNIFCAQRKEDIDARVRALFDIGLKVYRYGLSSGRSTPAFAHAFSRKQLVKSEGEMQRDVFIILNGKYYKVRNIFWKIPPIFEYFREIDRKKKIDLIFGSEEDRREEEKRLREEEKKKRQEEKKREKEEKKLEKQRKEMMFEEIFQDLFNDFDEKSFNISD